MKVFPRRRMWLSLSGILVCAILFFGILSVVYWLRFSSSAYFGEARDIYVLARNRSATVKQSQIPLALAPALVNMHGIEVVSPELFIYGVLNDKAVIVRGIYPRDFYSLENLRVIDGRWLSERDVMGAVAGYNLAHKLGLQVNETYVLSGSEVDDFLTIQIVGIFRTGGMIDDDLLLNMRYARFLQQETPEGYASIIRVKVNTTIWPTVGSVWKAVSGPPTVSSLKYQPEQPNNTEKIEITCDARAFNQIGSVILQYNKSVSKTVHEKTMEMVGPVSYRTESYRTEIGPVKDSAWIVLWAKAVDVLGHEFRTDPVNVSVADALGPDIFDVDIQPPPPQTKDDNLNLSFKAVDSSDMVKNVTVYAYNEGRNVSVTLPDSSGGLYTATLGRFEPGQLLVWISARDRFDNPRLTGFYTYRILNRTDQSAPEISEMLYVPTPPYDNSTVNITVRITDDSNITLAEIMYDFQVKGRHFNATLALNRSTEKGLWTATLGSFPGATNVHLKIFAQDEFGNAGYSQPKKLFIRYSEPPEEFFIYRFPSASIPGINNLLAMYLYDASEIARVNINFSDRGIWRNLSIPVSITTFKEALLLGRLSPGTKQYSVAMTDGKNQTTRTPIVGQNSYLVSKQPPSAYNIRYLAEVLPDEYVIVSFNVSSLYPTSHVYITDSRGVIIIGNWTGSNYVATLGPYWRAGDYSFVINVEDSAGNAYRSPEMPLTVLDKVIQDIDFFPKPPLLGEDLTVTCRVIGDSPGATVDLIGPMEGRIRRIPMSMQGNLRTATIRIDQPAIIAFSIEARIGNAVYRSETYRISVASWQSSLFVTHDPSYPASTDDLVIQIRCRDAEQIYAVVLNWTNGSYTKREVWTPRTPDFAVDFHPGTQIANLLYRVEVTGSKGVIKYPTGTNERVKVSVARNLFDPPEIIYHELSPLSYINLAGVRPDDFLIAASCVVADEEGLSKVWIEYSIGQTPFTDPLLPSADPHAPFSGGYTAYLGPFALNTTITAGILATDLAGKTSSTAYFQYTLMDMQPPDITNVYHDPLDPSPEQEVTIGCDVTDDSGIKEVLLIMNDTKGEYRETMSKYGDIYTLQIISPKAGEAISYRMQATDSYGNSNQTAIRTIRSIDINAPDIYEVIQEPLQPTDKETVKITIGLIDREDEVQNVTLMWYQYEWKQKTQEGGKGFLSRVFTINASELEPGIDVRYKVEAYDRSGNKAVYPKIQQPESVAQALAQLAHFYGSEPSAGKVLGALAQRGMEPYLTFRVIDRTPPSLFLEASPSDPNELQTVTFSIRALDNHLLKNLTLVLIVDEKDRGYHWVMGRPSFEEEVSSGHLKPGGSVVSYLEAYDQSGNYARYPSSTNLTISVKILEWGGLIAVIDPTVNLEVSGPASFSEDMARQGAGKILASINGILFMTFLATIAGIGNIIYSSIYKSKREIGIVRTLGGSKKFITLLVASLTILVGFLAGLMGCGIAYLLMVVLSRLGASLAWVTLRPTFDLLVLGATVAASVTISVFGGLVALGRLFSYTPIESIKTLLPPAPKETEPTYIERTKAFSGKTIAVLLLLIVSAAAMMRLYPTWISAEPFDPDSWLHLQAAKDMGASHRLRLDYDSREMQAVSALPGLNILLLFAQELTGTELLPARILTPLASSLGLLFVFVLARRISRSALVGGIACLVLAFAGFYTNRTAALTKEALGLQLLLFCLLLLCIARQLQSTKYKVLTFLAFVVLIFTHHLTGIYFVLVFSGYLALVNLQRYSKGTLDRREAKRDGLLLAAVLATFMTVTLTLGRYETRIPLQDALLILSLFFIVIGFGRLLLASSFMNRHRRLIALICAVAMVASPILAHRAGLFAYGPWEQVMPMMAPHLVLLALAVLAVFPLSILSEEQKAFLLAWISAVLPFILFGVVKRDLFGYILLFRNIAYGYQLSAIMLAIAVVYAYKRFESARPTGLRRLAVAVFMMLLVCNIGLASYTGFLSKDYETKDLYHPEEMSAALKVNASTLRGQLVGADERGRRLLLYVTGEDGDQVTTYVYLVRMEKYVINQYYRTQFEMTDRPLTHIFLYSEMYRVGFIDSVVFREIPRLRLNRFEDVVFDNGDDELIYVARKDWP